MRTSNVLALLGVLLAAGSLIIAIRQIDQPVTLKSPDERSELVTKIFGLEMIGAQKSFVESVTGPAVMQDEFGSDYKLGECNLRVVYSGNLVAMMTIRIGVGCPFSWEMLLDGGYETLPPPSSATLGDVMRVVGSFEMSSDCLHFCGNATGDHFVDMVWGGSHSMNWQKVSVSADADTNETELIFKKMEKQKGSSFAPLSLCDADLRPFVEDVAKLRVAAVTLGANSIDCHASPGSNLEK